MLSHEDEFSVKAMCRVLEVTRSGYYVWKRCPESDRAAETRCLDADIRRIYEAHQGRYGSPRVTKDLREEGWRELMKRGFDFLLAKALECMVAEFVPFLPA